MWIGNEMLRTLVLDLCLCVCLTIQAPICTPTITEGKIGKPEIGGFISLECESATCNKAMKVVFEKADLNSTWIPVFEGFNKTHYKALNTTADYTLEHRNYFSAFRASVNSLHILPIILQDHGEWRCVVYDVTGKEFNSGSLDVNVYVPPPGENFFINPNNSHILIHQTQAFTCVANGIHPETNVLWKMNGIEYKGDAFHQQRADKLWVIMNTIKLRFDTIGVNKLNCILPAKARDKWMEYHINITVQAPICTPKLEEGQMGQPGIGGFISLECGIETCLNLTKLVFEKADLNALWTPMFEGVNQTYHKALDTATEYNIKNRNYYYAFRTNVHSLHIMPLILLDHGEWRCVVYDVTGEEYISAPLDVNIYVTPADGSFYISPNSLHLVLNQTQEFICAAHGIHPKPEVLWRLNGVEHKGNVTTKQGEDQLWDVMNVIKTKLHRGGVNEINCVMRTPRREPWVENRINVTVQEPATVGHPRRNKTETVDAFSTFSLSCDGSGYNPHITWNRDGDRIFNNDTRYIIEEECVQLKCEGSITSKLMDHAIACDDEDHYSGVYTCVIRLEPPYNSSAESADVNVTISKQQCKEENIVPVAVVAILFAVVVTVIGVSLVLLIRTIRRKRGPAEEQLLENPEVLKLKEMSGSITARYETQEWLLMCSQSEGYDTIVFFDYGSTSVFIHDTSDLEKYKKYTCGVKIFEMIRISEDTYVVTEHGAHTIYLLRLLDDRFHQIHTMVQDKQYIRTLICGENDNSFIKCEFSGGYLQNKATISRVCLSNDKLESQILTPEPYMVRGEPWRISLIGNSKELLILNMDGRIYRGDLSNYNPDTYDEFLAGHIDTAVRALYIDKKDNVIVGSRSGNIHVYTHDKQHSVKQVGVTVRGTIVIDKRLFVCSGIDKKEQYIKVFSYEDLFKDCAGGGEC